MACGWAPLIKYVTDERGAETIGLKRSQGKADALRKNGCHVLVKD